jgi:hypothetical protein
VLLPLLFFTAQATVPDTAWTLTLPENEYVTDAFFSHDDSLLVVTKQIITDDTNAIVEYFTIYNSYTGQAIRHLKERMNSRYNNNLALKPGTDLLYLYFTKKYDSLYHLMPEQKFLIYNISTGNIIDSLYFINNESDLKLDTSRIWQMDFTPDSEHLFIRANVIKYYGYDSIPEWTQKLFVWNTNNWTLERKRQFGNRAWFGIAPNNRYYFEPIINPAEYFLFDDINSDSTIYTLQDNDSIKYEGVIFPKTDTNKFLVRYFDIKDSRYKFQVRSQSDFSVIKTIDNDTLQNIIKINYTDNNQFIICQGANNSVLEGYNYIFDLINERIVYVYPAIYYHWLGNSGSSFLVLSNNSEMIFDGGKRQNYMLNAKYTTTSTEKPNEDKPNLIYPNPASDYIEINLPPLERGLGGVAPVHIFDLLGMELTTPNLTPTLSEGEGVVRLDVSSLSPGVYFVRVGDVVRKFIKM